MASEFNVFKTTIMTKRLRLHTVTIAESSHAGTSRSEET